MTRSLRVPDPETRGAGRPLPEVALTPVMRGFPGGIADIAHEDDFAPEDFLGPGAFAQGGPAAAAPDADLSPESLDASATAWQRSLSAWQAAGIDWQRPPRGRALDADYQLTEPIPAVRPSARDMRAGRPRKTAKGRRPRVDGGRGGQKSGEGHTAGRRSRTTGRGRARNIAIAVGASAVLLTVAITTVAIVRPRPADSAWGHGLLISSLPAVTAGADFPAARATVVFPALAGVAADGQTVVAVGSQARLPYARPVILASRDGGRTWQRAVLRVRGSGVPPAGAAPSLIAGGQGRWVALGRKVGWISSDGGTWQAAPGVAPQVIGDRVVALARTGSGFLALGDNSPDAAQPAAGSPVVWASPDGRTWRRQSAAQLGLSAPAGGVLALRWAASHGSAVVIGGEITRTTVRHRKGRHVRVRSQFPALWRSTDRGVTWTRVSLPAARGASGGLAGLAASSYGFVAVRPGHASGRRLGALVYVSAHGSRWRIAHRLSVRRAALHVSAVAGSDTGVVVAGTAGPRRVAFVSEDGKTWLQTAALGKPSLRSVAAVTVSGDGAVVAAGTGRRPGTSGPRPFLLLAWNRSWLVGRTALTGSTFADVTVRGLATGAGTQVAVGSADDAPGIWWEPAAGRWSPATAALPPSWRKGARLDAVVDGAAGWLAVGRGSGHAAAPVIMTSPHGRAWHPASGRKLFAAPGTTLTQVAAGPSGYVAVGARMAGGRAVASAWYSASLKSWRLARNAGKPAGLDSASQMLAVTATGAGFVAVGSEGNAPAVWASPDGRAWRPAAAPRPGRGAGPVLTGVSAKDQRVVAVGVTTTRAGPAPFAAVSRDGGLTWRTSRLPAPAGPASVTALTTSGGGFIAAGVSGIPGNTDVLVWWSADGLSWHMAAPGAALLRGPGAQKLTAVSVSGSLLTGAGYSATWGAEHPVLWHARVR